MNNQSQASVNSVPSFCIDISKFECRYRSQI